MSDDWQIATLGELCSMRYGKLLPKTSLSYVGVGYPVWSGYSVVGYHDEFMFEEPEVSITCRGVGGTGNIHMTPPKSWVTNLAIVIRPFSTAGIRKDFLYWAMLATDRQHLITGSAQSQITIDHLKHHQVRFPAEDEQRAIASVLGALDDKIEKNRRTAQALEKLARAIFRAWFVDFEPVKAKAAGATNFPSMPQPVFDALPTRLVDSAIGPVPEGWGVGAIKDLATLSKAQVKPQEHPEEPFDHFSIPAFDAGMRAVVEPGSAIKSNKFLVVDGCVLLSKLNPRIARIWLPPSAHDRKQIASTELLVFVPAEASDRHYLYCQFQQREFRDELAQSASGTSNSHQRVRPKDILSHPIVMPVPSVRKAFANVTDPLFALRAANHDESAHLAEMRDYLLPKLLSGKVRVATSTPEANK